MVRLGIEPATSACEADAPRATGPAPKGMNESVLTMRDIASNVYVRFTQGAAMAEPQRTKKIVGPCTSISSCFAPGDDRSLRADARW